MHPSTASRPDLRSLPARYVHDSAAGRARVVLDVYPAPIDDLEVRVAPDRVVVSLEGPAGRSERSFRPPSTHRVFDGDHDAVYHNGVLAVTLETPRRARRASD